MELRLNTAGAHRTQQGANWIEQGDNWTIHWFKWSKQGPIELNQGPLGYDRGTSNKEGYRVNSEGPQIELILTKTGALKRSSNSARGLWNPIGWGQLNNVRAIGTQQGLIDLSRGSLEHSRGTRNSERVHSEHRSSHNMRSIQWQLWIQLSVNS